MKDIDQITYEQICQVCGIDFDHPGSCEICLDDERMNALRDYEIKKAKEKDYSKD